MYMSHKFGELVFRTADPEGEEERRKFAHYLWNAGVLMGEFVGGRGEGREGLMGGRGEKGKGGGGDCEEEKEKEEKGWWLDAEEEERWCVEGETVLELGAGW